MTVRENTLIRRGIHSELFLWAYLKPDSGYALAKRHQDIKCKPDTSKTGPALQKLKKAKYLILKNGKFYPNFDKLSEDLITYLKSTGVDLDENESKFLQKLITLNSFFALLSSDIPSIIQNQPERIHHIDALKIFANKIGMICTFALFGNSPNIVKNPDKSTNARKSIQAINKELSRNIKKYNKKIMQVSKNQSKKRYERINLLNSSIASWLVSGMLLERTEKSTLEKLAVLWDQYEGFQMGLGLQIIKDVNMESLFD